jgi:hypothetical protein
MIKRLVEEAKLDIAEAVGRAKACFDAPAGQPHTGQRPKKQIWATGRKWISGVSYSFI